MALMWPRQLPPEIRSNPLRSTECAVFEKLSRELDQSWWVFYSRPWLGLTPTGEEIDGECDFVVAHPQKGILCIEVKGGQVAWDPLSGKWSSKDRMGIVHSIKDPVQQARASKHEIVKRLRALPGLQNRWIRARHGVMLPGSGRATRDMGPDRPLHIFCFAEQFERGAAEWVESRFTRAEENERDELGLGQIGMNTLRDLLALPIALTTPLAHLVRADENELQYLTQQQFHLLSAIKTLPRVLIQGGAGTGKTVMATHLANQLARTGTQTALICYNEALAESLSSELASTPNLWVGSFHRLCRTVLERTGTAIPSDSNVSKFFEELLPEAAAMGAAKAGAPRFDAIVVDEGQDFREFWWLVVEALLSPAGPRLLRIFADTNQKIYGDPARVAADLTPIPIHLTWNLRNTRRIHEVAYRHYDGIPVSCHGPEGETPECIVNGSRAGIQSSVTQLLNRLLAKELLQPEQISVLVPDQTWVGELCTSRAISGVPVAKAGAKRAGAVVVDTIRRYKGLEAPVVVLVVDAVVADSPELSYVAFTRARSRCFVIGEEHYISSVLGRQH